MEKCLHLLPMNKLSGAEKMVLLMCKNMNKYQPIVVCGGQDLTNIFLENSINSISINFSKKSINTLIRIKDIINEFNIKIIHAHDNIASIISYITKTIFKLDIKIVSHIHNCYPWLKMIGVNRFLDSVFRPKYDYNFACGKVVYDYYKQHSKYLNFEKVSILSNSIDIKEIEGKYLINEKNLRETYKIPEDKIILGYIGRITVQKGIIPFIKEFYKVKKEFEDCLVLIIGDGEQGQEAKKLIHELNLEDSFILTGFKKETYDFYPIIDIFFLPSIYEGLPMVILEAMAFNKAIISMNVGSISELINNNTGILIESNNYNKFINEMKLLKNNKNLRKQYGENAHKFVNEKYGIESYVYEIEKQYDKLLKVV